MRFNDRIWGMLLVMAGGTVVAFTLTFPRMAGQPVGPALFPGLIGGALAIFGGIMAWSGGTTRGTPSPDAEVPVRTPRMVRNFALVAGDVIFYALAVDALGFFITGPIFLAVLFLTFGVRRRWIAPIAAGVTLFIHFGFYTLLKVPLPWGLLEGIAW